MSSAPPEINILTFNCWGLKFLAKYRRQRLTEIGHRIAIADPVPHIVGLQECWTHEDYLSIRRTTKNILPHGKFYHSGIFGGGLVILSKWPIEESSMFRFPLNGRPTAFFRGDWFVGKGVAFACIRYGESPNESIEVFNTHMHAPYEREPNDSYMCHRTAQAWEISKLLNRAAERGHLVVGLGDFNMVPKSLAHRLITTHSPAQDVWLSLHPDSSIGAADHPGERARQRPIPTAGYNIRKNGATCDSILNTWRWSKDEQKQLGPNKPTLDVSQEKLDPKAKRLDYIFVNAKPHSKGGDWVIKSCKVGMLSRHPELKCSLSDHFSVEATIVSSNYAESTENNIDTNILNGVFLQSPTNSMNQSSQANSSTTFLPLNVYDDILNLVYDYRRREQWQRRIRLLHFVGSIAFSMACFCVLPWISSKYSVLILMILSTLSLSAGVIDGLIGGLFIGSEIRALKEFEWEISNVRAMSSGVSNNMPEEGIIDW